MKYLFILGRNIELSTEEVLSYFEKENNPILNYELNKNGLLIELGKPMRENEINNFGGVISIGELISSGNKENIILELEKKQIYLGKKNKINYVLWNFSENYEQIEDYLKKRFRSEKLKATLKHLTDEIMLQDGKKALIPSSKLLTEEYFIFGTEYKEYFGKIIKHCNYKSIELRDMGKPVRRESLAIAPRLAKIMINLSQVKKRDILLDPFCGVGTILQEALIQEIKVVGIDKDKDAIKGAKQNMHWFNFPKKDYEIINGDSTNTKIKEVSAVATEPDLGKILKKIPTKEQAKETLNQFENLMIQLINNIKSNVKGRIVFTSPNIRIGKKRISCNIEHICEKTGYKLIREGIPEFRDKQVVGRMIYILNSNSSS